jgi:hypothetical protein
MTGTNKQYSYLRVVLIRIDVHPAGVTRSTRHTLSTLNTCMVPDHTSHVVRVGNLPLVPTRSKQAPTPREVWMTKERLARPSSWVTPFPLPHDSLGVGEP